MDNDNNNVNLNKQNCNWNLCWRGEKKKHEQFWYFQPFSFEWKMNSSEWPNECSHFLKDAIIHTRTSNLSWDYLYSWFLAKANNNKLWSLQRRQLCMRLKVYTCIFFSRSPCVSIHHMCLSDVFWRGKHKTNRRTNEKHTDTHTHT